jgi:hypothetical protein
VTLPRIGVPDPFHFVRGFQEVKPAAAAIALEAIGFVGAPR